MNRPKQALGAIVVLLIALALASGLFAASAQQGAMPASESLRPAAAGPCSPACGGSGSYMQAEHATLTAPMTTIFDSAACDQVYIHTPQRTEAAEAVFTFHVQTAGQYNIWVRAMGLDLFHNSFWVSLDGQPADPGYQYEIPAFGGVFTWGWDALRQANASPAPVQLGVGWHNLRFRGREENARLDAVYITSDLSCNLTEYNGTPTPTATPNATQTPTRTPTPPGGVFPSSFTLDAEGAWPSSGWRVLDQGANDGGEYLFGPRSCYPRNGGNALWAVGGGADGSAMGCGSPYPNNMDAWAIYGPFSLAGATQADLSFYLYGNTEITANCSHDYLFAGASINGANFFGRYYCGPYQAGPDGRGFTRIGLDLSNYLGESPVWIGFKFGSDATVNDFGYMVDDVALSATFGAASRSVRIPIMIRKAQQSQPTLTPTRTRTQPPATLTPTPSPTPKPLELKYDPDQPDGGYRYPGAGIAAVKFNVSGSRQVILLKYYVRSNQNATVEATEKVNLEIWLATDPPQKVYESPKSISVPPSWGEWVYLSVPLDPPVTVSGDFFVGMRWPALASEPDDTTPLVFLGRYGSGFHHTYQGGGDSAPAYEAAWGDGMVRVLVW